MSGDLGVTMELLDFYEQVLSRNNSQGVVIMEKKTGNSGTVHG